MAAPRLTGRKSRFRGKLHGTHVMSIAFTPTGHEALARGQARTSLSRSDYLELLVRRADRRVRGAEKKCARDADSR